MDNKIKVMQKIKLIVGYIIGAAILALWIYSMVAGEYTSNPNHGDDQEYFIDK